MKKLLLGLGTIGTVIAPVASIVACGTTDTKVAKKVTPQATTDKTKTEGTTHTEQVVTPVVTITLPEAKATATTAINTAGAVEATALTDTSKTPDATLVGLVTTAVSDALTKIGTGTTADEVLQFQKEEIAKIETAIQNLSDSNELVNLIGAAIVAINGTSLVPSVTLADTNGVEDATLKAAIPTAKTNALAKVATATTAEEAKQFQREEVGKIVAAVDALKKSNENANTLAEAQANFTGTRTKAETDIQAYVPAAAVTPLTDANKETANASLAQALTDAKAQALKDITDAPDAPALLTAITNGESAIDTASAAINDSNILLNQILEAKDKIDALAIDGNYTTLVGATLDKSSVTGLVTAAKADLDTATTNTILDAKLGTQTTTVNDALAVLNLATAKTNGIKVITDLANGGTYTALEGGTVNKDAVLVTAVGTATAAINAVLVADAGTLPGVISAQRTVITDAISALNLATAAANTLKTAKENAIKEVEAAGADDQITKLTAGNALPDKSAVTTAINNAKAAINASTVTILTLPQILIDEKGKVTSAVTTLNTATDGLNQAAATAAQAAQDFPGQKTAAKGEIQTLSTTGVTASTTGTPAVIARITAAVNAANTKIDNEADKAALDSDMPGIRTTITDAIALVNADTVKANTLKVALTTAEGKIDAIVADDQITRLTGASAAPNHAALDGVVQTAKTALEAVGTEADLATALGDDANGQTKLVKDALAALNLATAKTNGIKVLNDLDANATYTPPGDGSTLDKSTVTTAIADGTTAINGADAAGIANIITTESGKVSQAITDLNTTNAGLTPAVPSGNVGTDPAAGTGGIDPNAGGGTPAPVVNN